MVTLKEIYIYIVADYWCTWCIFHLPCPYNPWWSTDGCVDFKTTRITTASC